MAVKVTLDPTQGLVQTDVDDSNSEALPSGFSPHRLPVRVLSDNTTLDSHAGGVYEVTSSTAGAKTVTMPLAASSAGMLLSLRSTSADAHVLTASQEANGTRAFSMGLPVATTTGSNGSRLTLGATAGSSVALMCDGQSWMVLGGSGSLALAGT